MKTLPGEVLWEVFQHREKWRFHPFDFGVIRSIHYIFQIFESRMKINTWKQQATDPITSTWADFESLHLGEKASGSGTAKMGLNNTFWWQFLI